MKIGGNSITAAYLGSTAINRVYLGAARLFDAAAGLWSSVGVMTDIDSDIDDVVAEALLFDLLREQGKPLSYFSVASRSNTAAHCQRVLLDQAGYSSVPLGQMQTPTSANSTTKYNEQVAALKQPVLGRIDYPGSVAVMRTALAAMPDQSHKIITIGNLTDYAALLQSPADGISPLTGIELVAAKVISVHAMGGRYPNTTTTEANVNGDTPSANYVAANTPVPIYWAPYALGNDVLTRIPTAGYRSDLDAYVVAWNAYGAASRESWDSIPVLHAMLGLNDWFTDLGPHDANFTNGSAWTPSASGKNYPLGRSTTATVLRDYINGRVVAFMDTYGMKITPAAPVFTADPVASGTAAEGSLLSVSNGTVTGFPAPTYAYQWRRNGTAISGATSAIYTVGAFTLGDLITCAVTATNSEGSATAVSNALEVVEAADPTVVVLDTFTQPTAGPLISTQPTDSGHSWTLTSGSIRYSGAPGSVYSDSTALAEIFGFTHQDSFDLEVDILSVTTVNRSVVARCFVSNNSNYIAIGYQENTGWRIGRKISNVYTALATVNQTLVAGQSYALRATIRAGVLNLFVDGVQVITDLTLTNLSSLTGRKVGIETVGVSTATANTHISRVRYTDRPE